MLEIKWFVTNVWYKLKLICICIYIYFSLKFIVQFNITLNENMYIEKIYVTSYLKDIINIKMKHL